MFGYPAAQALGAVLHSLVAPERYRAAQAAGFAGFRATGQGAAIGKTLELVACRRDGTEFPIELSLSAVRMKDRWCAVGIVRDVTQRKQAEQELEHYRLHLEELVEARTLALTLAEERSRLILESSGDGIYGLDLEGRCTFINPAACALLGYESQDLLGRPLHDLIQHSWADGRSCPASECPMWLTLRGGQVLRKDDERFRHADGHLVPVAYSSHPIQQDGVITGAVVSVTDISAPAGSAGGGRAAGAAEGRIPGQHEP
jgi:PAS domain S-box-containing protein